MPTSRRGCIGRPTTDARDRAARWPTSWPTCSERGDAAVLEYTAASTGSMRGRWTTLETRRRPSCSAAFDALPAAQRDALRSRRRARAQLPRAPAARPAARAGATATPTARCSARRSRRSTASASTCRAARRPIRRRVLMNAIPAQVAGVGEIVMVVPTPRRRDEPAGAGRRARGRRRPRVHHRRRAGGRRAGLRHGHDPARSTRSPAPATPMSRAPSGACSARSAST